jgi:hypothetical protein
MAVNVAARADALHNFLAEIAAFAEMKGTQLRGFLWQIAFGDVDSVQRNPFSNAEGLKRGGAHGGGTGGGERAPQDG